MKIPTLSNLFPVAQSGFVDPDDCRVLQAALAFLEDQPSVHADDWRPEALVTSHFVNPWRSLSAVRRFLNGQAGCDIFRTPNRAHSEWAVLESTDLEVHRAQQQLRNERFAGEDCYLKYVLSKPFGADGQWQHVFYSTESVTDRWAAGKSVTAWARAGWHPADSGGLVPLHDVCLGNDAARRLPRWEMLRGLACHCVGQSSRLFLDVPTAARPVPRDNLTSLQCSPDGVRYLIYTAHCPGPTHIFTELEQ